MVVANNPWLGCAPQAWRASPGHLAAPGYEHHVRPLAARYGVEVVASSARWFSRGWVRSVPADLAANGSSMSRKLAGQDASM